MKLQSILGFLLGATLPINALVVDINIYDDVKLTEQRLHRPSHALTKFSHQHSVMDTIAG
jgi:hypothetical protein